MTKVGGGLSLLPLALLALLLWASPARANEIANAELGFKLDVPNYFVATDPKQLDKKTLYAFRREGLTAADVGMVITVTRLQGVIGREAIAPAAGMTVTTEKWREFDVSVVRAPQTLKGKPSLVLGVQIPLVPEAIQINMVGEATKEAELMTILRGVIASVNGKTNWLTNAERSERMGSGLMRMLTIAFVIVAIVGFTIKKIRDR